MQNRINDTYYILTYGLLDNGNKINDLQSANSGNVLQINDFKVDVTDGEGGVQILELF